jgi:hypothetical protein
LKYEYLAATSLACLASIQRLILEKPSPHERGSTSS